MSNKIHRTATIGKNVVLGDNNEIAENVIIRGDIKFGNNNFIGPNSVIVNNVSIGNNNIFHGLISIGTLGEMGSKGDIFLRNGQIRIGNDNVFREFITINSPVRKITTSIGSRCYFMARTHLPHDVEVLDNVVMATNSLIGGGCVLEEYVYVGLNAHIHQWLRIGEGSILGINSATIKNVPPFSTVAGIPSRIIKINEEGLKRRDFSVGQISELSAHYNDCIANVYVGKSVLLKKLQEFLNENNNCLELK